MHSAQSTHSAFTLIELMASIVLLALVASIGAVGLASIGKAAAVERAVSVALSADRSARILASESGPVRLETTDRSTKLTLISQTEEFNVRTVDLPAGILIELIDPDLERALEAVSYDSHGRCDDFYVRVRTGERTRTWRIAGLTGWTEQLMRPTP